ncbi:MAG: 5-dehydro-4-deoxy-D-glucuronate isomerase [Desulforhopalus sp.]
MDIRYAVHPEHAAVMDTTALRKNFLIQNLFAREQLNIVYSYNDRLIVGGVCPGNKAMPLDIDEKIIGGAYLLERREMGVINVGGAGTVAVDEKVSQVAHKDGLYIGKGAKKVIFSSDDPQQPAKFYFNSAPAHAPFPTTAIKFAEAEPVVLGDADTSNHRTIRKFIHPAGVKSCQLVMGMTTLETGSVWNTMPTHTHERRMEAYFYFDMPDDQVVFHFMGEPGETRHVIVRQDEAVLSPSWSIHSGAGTSSYTFIWGMAGENQVFDDMDGVAMSEMK